MHYNQPIHVVVSFGLLLAALCLTGFSEEVWPNNHYAWITWVFLIMTPFVVYSHRHGVLVLSRSRIVMSVLLYPAVVLTYLILSRLGHQEATTYVVAPLVLLGLMILIESAYMNIGRRHEGAEMTAKNRVS